MKSPPFFVARIFFGLALFLPTLFALSQSNGFGRGLEIALWALAASSVLATLPAKLFKLIQIIFLITLPYLLWWIGYASLNGIGPVWEAARAAIITNRLEALSALSLLIHTPIYIFSVLTSVSLLILSCFFSFIKKGNDEDNFSKRIQSILLFLFLSLFAVSSISSVLNLRSSFYFQNSDPDFSPLGTALHIFSHTVDELLWGDLMDVVSDRSPGHAEFLVKSPMLALFVVGESIRADGIGPKTVERGMYSKALANRVLNNLGSWLPPTCASSYGTYASVPLLLTGIIPSKQPVSSRAPSVLAILRSGGYKTAWITNQETSVFLEDGHDFYWSRGIQFRGAFDEAVVPVVASFFNPVINGNSQVPRAALVHIMGSHFQYEDRYPSSVFPSEPEGTDLADLRDLRYERSEEYTAKLLVQILDLLDRSPVPAFLVFSGDHGENLARDRNGLLTHLGPLASIHDGTTSSFVFWNRAMYLTGKTSVLEPFRSIGLVAHADISKIFLSLSGVSNTSIEPDRNPEILAPVRIGGLTKAYPCSMLLP